VGFDWLGWKGQVICGTGKFLGLRLGGVGRDAIMGWDGQWREVKVRRWN
jgi:hypothetical protein